MDRRGFLAALIAAPTLAGLAAHAKSDPRIFWATKKCICGPTFETSYNPPLLSNEALDDIRNWGVDQIDEATRKAIFNAGPVDRIFSCSKLE